MPFTRRDSAVVVALVLALVGIGGVIAMPAPPPAATAPPSARPTLPPPVTYREGVVGTPTSITPVTARTRSERMLVRLLFSGLVRLGPGSTYEPDLASG